VSRASRAFLAVGVTIVAIVAAAVYPWLSRPDAWLGATFQYPWFLIALLVVPVIWWWGTFGQDRRKPHLRIGTVSPLARGPRGARAHLRDIPGIFRAVAVAFLVLAIARPVSMLRDQSSDDKGIDIVLALDLSGSMRAVLDADPKDLPGNPQIPKNRRLTRFETAKIVIRDFIARRKTDRIGVVVFGKHAYVLSPPTLDYHLLTQLVSKLGLDVIDGNATAIGDAMGTAVARLRRSDARSKVIVLLTDGDSNAGAVSPEYATHLAATTGCKVYTIQIGGEDEVDVDTGSVDLLGQPVYQRHRFPVNPALLRKIANDTGGQAFVATDAKALASSMHAVLNQLEKTRFEASISSFEDLFPFLLVSGVALVALDALLRAWLLRRFP
jgi:Ca-activated chloride channel family protein